MMIAYLGCIVGDEHSLSWNNAHPLYYFIFNIVLHEYVLYIKQKDIYHSEASDGNSF